MRRLVKLCPGLALAVIACLATVLSAESATAADPCPGGVRPCPYSGVSIFAPHAPGSLQSPRAVAVNPTDDSFYVVDELEPGVQHFSAAGQWIATLTDPAWSSSTALVALAIDPSATHLFALSQQQDRVTEFDLSSGAVVRRIGDASMGSSTDVAVDATTLYTADGQNRRVDRYRLSTGAVMTPLGNGSGSGPGQFVGTSPAAVEVVNGTIWTRASLGGDRVQRYTAATSTWTVVPDSTLPMSYGLGRMTYDGDHTLYIGTSTGVARVDTTTATMLAPLATTPAGNAPDPSRVDEVGDLGFAHGALLALDSDTGRVGRAGISAYAPATGVWSYRVRRVTTEPWQPDGLAVAPDGDVWVADPVLNQLQRYSSTGVWEQTIGRVDATAGSASGEFDGVDDVKVYGGEVYASDHYNGRVQVYGLDGAFRRSIYIQGNQASDFYTVGGVAVDQNGVFVVDLLQKRLQWFSHDGATFRGATAPVSGLGFITGTSTSWAGGVSTILLQLNDPSGSNVMGRYTATAAGGLTATTAVPLPGNRGGVVSSVALADGFLVLDEFASRVARYQDGSYVWAFGSQGTCPGQLYGAQGLALDPAGDLYVSDQANKRIQRFDLAAPTTGGPGGCADQPSVGVTITPLTAAQQAATSGTLSFSADQLSEFECMLDFGAYVPCTTPAEYDLATSGTLAYSGLQPGVHTVYVRAYPEASGVATTATGYSWRVGPAGPIAPTVSITSGPTGTSAVASATFTWSVSPTSFAGAFFCRLDAGALVACTSPTSYAALANGAHTFAVKAGADGAETSRTWIVAVPEPVVTPPPVVTTPAPVTPIPPILSAPAPPGGLRLTFKARGKATLTWTAPPASTTAPRTGFRVACTGSKPVVVTSTKVALKKTTTGRRYTCTVTSLGPAGSSAPSMVAGKRKS